MNAPPLRIEQHDHVRWLHLSRPGQRNALDDALIEALEAQVEDIERDDDTSVVVVAGDGPSFSAGGDFRHFLREAEVGGVVPFLRRVSDCFTRIEHSSKPWIAALHGHAIAGGLELALVCDVVVAAEGTLIGDGHLNNRLLPGAGSSVRLERAVGRSTARWMHLSGEPAAAEALASTGWLHDVVPPDALHSAAQRLAERLAARHSGAQRNFKRLLVEIADLPTDAALRAELARFDENWTESNVAEALTGFIASRGARRAGAAPDLTENSEDTAS